MGIQTVWTYAHNILRSSRQLVNAQLREVGLSSAEGNILLQLLTQGDKVRQEDIVLGLDVSKPAVSRALNSLETKGYVLRERDPGDKRVSRVLLTQTARAIEQRLVALYDGVFSLAAAGLSSREVASVVELLGRVSDNFASARGKQGAP